MTAAAWTKDPDSTVKFTFDWELWLEELEEVDAATTIDTVSVTADAGITVGTTTNSDTAVTTTLSGGTAGEIYTVTCQITTANGQTDQRSARVRVIER